MNNTVYAKTKYVRMSAQKVRLVVDMVRGKNALEALVELKFVNKYAALPVIKTIESAVANAVNNDDADRKSLVIVEAFVNEAPTFKRGRAVSKGRYHKILKRNSHIIIGVSDQKKEDTKKVKKEVAPEAKVEVKEIKKKSETKTKSKAKSNSNSKKKQD